MRKQRLARSVIMVIFAEPMEILKEFSVRDYLTAGRCNASGEMPLPSFVSALIETATAHSNDNNFGYARLIRDNCSWVLSRVTARIARMPSINEWYTIKTWVEDVGRLMTSRCYVMTDDDGNTLAEVRTNWCAINIDTRRPADLHAMLPEINEYVNAELVCPLEATAKPRPVKTPAGEGLEYAFVYSDLDFNRHVNSCRYVELLLDLRDMAFYDANRLEGFDLVFLREAHEGHRATVIADRDDAAPGRIVTELRGEDGTHYCVGTFDFVAR